MQTHLKASNFPYRMNDKDLNPEDKDMIALQALADKANTYAKMNW